MGVSLVDVSQAGLQEIKMMIFEAVKEAAEVDGVLHRLVWAALPLCLCSLVIRYQPRSLLITFCVSGL